jgi:hypothetical protein
MTHITITTVPAVLVAHGRRHASVGGIDFFARGVGFSRIDRVGFVVVARVDRVGFFDRVALFACFARTDVLLGGNR